MIWGYPHDYGNLHILVAIYSDVLYMVEMVLNIQKDCEHGHFWLIYTLRTW